MSKQVNVDTDAFVKSLKKYERSLESALLSAHKDNIEELEKESIALAPFKTGALMGSTKTEVRKNTDGVVGSVTFEVPHAAIRHNDLGSNPGPGTRGKSPTTYGVPGPNYLQNPGRGLGKDRTFHKNIDKEVKKI